MFLDENISLRKERSKTEVLYTFPESPLAKTALTASGHHHPAPSFAAYLFYAPYETRPQIGNPNQGLQRKQETHFGLWGEKNVITIL